MKTNNFCLDIYQEGKFLPMNKDMTLNMENKLNGENKKENILKDNVLSILLFQSSKFFKRKLA